MHSLEPKERLHKGAAATEAPFFAPEHEPVRLLKAELEELFGRRVLSSRDCIQLSEEIYFKTGNRINFNTLRRFFGLVKAPHPPSRSTLNILSLYCGFNSLDELAALRQAPPENGQPSEKATLLHFLTTLYKVLPVRTGCEEAALSLVKHTIGFVYASNDLSDKFHKAIARTAAGQELFFEQFVNIDQPNGAFGRGLGYYLKEKKSGAAQVFGHSVLCLRDWLNNDGAGLKKHFDWIKKNGLPEDAGLLAQSHYLSAHLLYADAFGLHHGRVAELACSVLHQLQPSREGVRKPLFFISHLAQVFIFTGHYDEALFFVNSALKKWPECPGLADKGLYQKLLLIKAIALLKTGEPAAAEGMFQQLRPSQFYFFSKKTDTILFMGLAHVLKKGSVKMDEQVQWLIDATGFIKLKEFR